MKYTKYENIAYNLHIINTNKFKTVMIKINFKKKIEDMDITKRSMLIKILLESSKNYPSSIDIEKECEELYNIGISSNVSTSGNYILTSFSAYFLNELYTEKDYNKKSIDFILDLIFNPNINNGFEYFDLIKRNLTDEINSIKEDTRNYSITRTIEELGYKFANNIGNIDDLNKITNEDLYKCYLEMLKSDLVDIFIIGDIDVNSIKKQIENSFSINTLKRKKYSHFIQMDKFRSKPKLIIEKYDSNQSKLNIGFKLNNLTDFELKYVMYVYTFILGGSPDSKLFKNVREKNSLCYTISCFHKPVINTMIISSGIDFKDYKKCLKIIKQEMKKISKGDFEESDIEAAKITYLNSLKEITDSNNSIIKIYETMEYLNYDSIEIRNNEINKVTKDDIVKLSKKIIMDIIYIMGGKDEN